MKKTLFYIFCGLAFIPKFMVAQADSLHQLKEVILDDVHLLSGAAGNNVSVLQDSVILKNPATLTELLRFNTPLYFRENGPGMVSSVSFRGTSASQTAVIWNGININSSINGQTDFNTLLSKSYDRIAIRSGGGSLLYGSGAIGGSVHLENSLKFKRLFENRIQLEAGSFSTYMGHLSSDYGDPNTSLKVSLSHLRSENDFPYPDSQQNNVNGDFQRTGLNLTAAQILDDSNMLRFYANYSTGERGFSGTLTAPSESKYVDSNSRNLLEWETGTGRWTSEIGLALLHESYRYYEDRHSGAYAFGQVDTGILKYEFGYEMSRNLEIITVGQFRGSQGEGSQIGEVDRQRYSGGILMRHQLGDFGYEVGFRKEFSGLYDSPILYSLGSAYQFSDHYELRLSFSRNYRIPTFNDLFWYAGGNQELKSEKSLQGEVTQKLSYKSLSLSLTAFLLEVEDLLRWVPGQDGLWHPENTREARNYGLELGAGWETSLNHTRLAFSGTYAYTRSRDLQLEKDLIYVPIHKANGSFAMNRGRISTYLQGGYTGKIFTSSDNEYFLEDHVILNLGFDFSLVPKHLQAGIVVRNLLNTEYQNMPSRPMPGRNFSLDLTFNF